MAAAETAAAEKPEAQKAKSNSKTGVVSAMPVCARRSKYDFSDDNPARRYRLHICCYGDSGNFGYTDKKNT